MSKPLDPEVLRAKASQAIQRPDSFQKSLAGTRKEHTQFSRTLEALLTGLLLEPGAFFHLLSLQKNIVLRDLAALSDDLEQVLVGIADSLDKSRAKSSTSLASAEARLQSSIDRGTIADLREVEGLRTALRGARNFARVALLPDLRGGGTGSTSRARPEALLDVVEPLERLEKSLPLLLRRLTSFLAAGDEIDPVAARAYLSPFMLQRAQEMFGKVSRGDSEGSLGSSAQEGLVTVLAPEAAVDALSSARHPTGYVLRTLPHHAGSSVEPAGSRLRINSIEPWIPPEVTGTQHLSLPAGATLDLGGAAISLAGAGTHFLYSRELGVGPYTITEPQLLVSLAGTIYSAPLTLGSRTATQVVNELNPTLAPLGCQASVRHEKVYLQSPSPIILPESGSAAQPAELRTDNIVFPFAIPGGNLTLGFDLRDASGVTTYSHNFGGGLPLPNIAALIVELEGGALAAVFDFSAVGDQLIVTTKLSDISYILTLSTTSTVLALPVPPLPAVPFPFYWQDAGLGSRLYGASAVTEIGFDAGQASTDYYSVEEVVTEVNEAGQDILASAVSTSLYIGDATIRAGVLSPESSPTSTVQAGDIVQAGSYGTYVVLSAALPGYNVQQLDGSAPGTGISFPAEITRTVLKLVSTANDGSSMSFGNASGHVPLGLPVDTVIQARAYRFQLEGTLVGETRSKVQDLRVLGVTEGCTVRFANGVTSLISAVDPSGTYFDTADSLTDLGGDVIDILPAGRGSYRSIQAAIRLLKKHPFYPLLVNSRDVLRRAVEVLRAGVRSGATVSAAVDLARLLFLLSSTHRTSVTSAVALRRIGTTAAVTGQSVLDVLTSYVPTAPAAAREVAEAALSSLEEKGYDRAASLLLEGNYVELRSLTADTASSTKRVADSFRRVAEDLPQSQRLGAVLRSTNPISKARG